MSQHGIFPDTSYRFHRQKIGFRLFKKTGKNFTPCKGFRRRRKNARDIEPVYRNNVPYKNEKFHVILPDYKWGVFLNNEDSIYSLLSEMEALEDLEYPLLVI